MNCLVDGIDGRTGAEAGDVGGTASAPDTGGCLLEAPVEVTALVVLGLALVDVDERRFG